MRWVLYFCLVLVAASVCAGSATGGDSASDRHTSGHGVISAQDSYPRVSVLLTRYTGRDGAPQTWDELQRGESSPAQVERWQIVLLDNVRYIMHRYERSSSGDEWTVAVVNGFDGIQARSWGEFSDDGLPQSLIIQAVPPVEHFGSEVWALLGRSVFQMGFGVNWPEVTKSLEEVHSTDDNSKWIGSLPGFDRHAVEMIGIINPRGNLAIETCHLTVFRDEGRQFRNAIADLECTYAEDSHVIDGMVVPSTAIYSVQYFTGEYKDWSVTKLELEEIASVNPEGIDWVFAQQIPNGVKVADTRAKIGYVSGESIASIDGRAFVASAPLTGAVAENLDSILRDGYFDETILPINAEGKTSALHSWFTQPWGLGVSLGMAVLGLLVYRWASRGSRS